MLNPPLKPQYLNLNECRLMTCVVPFEIHHLRNYFCFENCPKWGTRMQPNWNVLRNCPNRGTRWHIILNILKVSQLWDSDIGQIWILIVTSLISVYYLILVISTGDKIKYWFWHLNIFGECQWCPQFRTYCDKYQERRISLGGFEKSFIVGGMSFISCKIIICIFHGKIS